MTLIMVDLFIALQTKDKNIDGVRERAEEGRQEGCSMLPQKG